MLSIDVSGELPQKRTVCRSASPSTHIRLSASLCPVLLQPLPVHGKTDLPPLPLKHIPSVI